MTMTNFDSRLQQELINLLIKLKNQANPSTAKDLAEKIRLLTQAKINNDEYTKVCYLLFLIAGENPSLMTAANAAFLKKFEEDIHLKNSLANQKKTR
jgi:hypothetical protein